jgi:hypothetical protein
MRHCGRRVGWALGGEQAKEGCSFLKKRTKKRSPVRASSGMKPTDKSLFASFSSEKEDSSFPQAA